MKKIIFIISFLLTIECSNFVYGAETNETLKDQVEALEISDFLQEAESYTKDTFSELDINDIYKNAISGNLNVNGIVKAILKLVGSETLNTIKTLRIYFSYYHSS